MSRLSFKPALPARFSKSAHRQIVDSNALANAGHLPAIQRFNNGDYEFHESRTLPLGIIPEQVFEEVSFSLAGSSLYLYTDGLSEGLARTLKGPDDINNLQVLIDRFTDVPRQQRLKRFAEEASKFESSFDDLTILLIEDRTTDVSEALSMQQ